MIPLATGAYSAASVILELLGWVAAVASRVPGRVGVLAGELRETALEWGLPDVEGFVRFLGREVAPLLSGR